MRNKVRGILVLAMALLSLPTAGIARQSAQQSQPRVAQFGLRQRTTNPVPIPPDARPPDRLLVAGPASSITALAFSPDGQWLATTGSKNTVIIWNAATGAEQNRLTWTSAFEQPNKLLFSPDGQQLAGLTTSGKVRVWDFKAGRALYTLNGGSSLLTYSPDGKVWAASVSGAQDNLKARIEIRDAATGHLVRTVSTDWYGISGLAIVRDGQLVASGATTPSGTDADSDEYDPQGTSEIFDIASGNPVKTSSLFPVVGPVSPDGRFMASVDYAKEQVIVTDLSNDEVKWTFQQTNPSTVFSPDSQELAVAGGGSERRLTVLSLPTGATICSLHDKPDPNDYTSLTALAFSADGRRIAAANYPEMSGKIWDLNAGQELREFAGQLSVQALAMSPDGKWLVSASPGVTLRDPATGKIAATLTLGDADMLLFSPDGRWLAANPGVPLGGMGNSLEVWDTRTWAPVASIKPPWDPRRNHPAAWFAFGNASAQGNLGNAQSLQFTADGQTHSVWYSNSPLAISPDGKLLAEVGSPMNQMEIWDIASGQKVEGFVAHKQWVQHLAFSRDGRSLLTFGQDALPVWNDTGFQGAIEYSVKVWDVATWKQRVSVTVPRIWPFSALLSPDGRRIAIERSRQVVDVVDANNGRLLGSFAATSPWNDVFARGKPNLAFSPDGTLLFQGAKNGIRVWKLPQP